MNKPGYIFTGEINRQVESFKGYLKDQHQDTNTIRQKSNYAGYYLSWLESEHLQVEDARYNDLLDFIDYCTLGGNSKKHINSKLRSIRNFYEYLKTNDPKIINPAANLFLKGVRQKVISGIIDYKELENLYQSYPAKTLREKRNKIILGLLVYQAVSTEELSKLEPGHVKLKEGKIHVQGSRRRGSRILELKPFQVLELHEYLTDVRRQIIEGISLSKPARRPDRINKSRLEAQLFISINGSENIKNSLLHLFRDVQKINPNVINALQIRQSVITHWLKNHNLRQVQYMAGHKYVSSTERYQRGNLENLQNKLEKYHPLSRTN